MDNFKSGFFVRLLNSRMAWGMVCFVMGFLLSMAIASSFHLFGAEERLLGWIINEEQDKGLILRPISDNIFVTTIGIKKNQIDLVQFKKDDNLICCFMYNRHGMYGGPSFYYGNPRDGIVWRDYNLDGVFDYRINYSDKTMEIYVQGSWVRGFLTPNKKVITDNGTFEFIPDSGLWQQQKVDKK